MAEKNSLLKRIQMYDFIVNEMILYLDTHPNDQRGLAYFKKYNDLNNKAHAEYAMAYGPLMPSQANSTERWTWVDAPWPWEREANL